MTDGLRKVESSAAGSAEVGVCGVTLSSEAMRAEDGLEEAPAALDRSGCIPTCDSRSADGGHSV